MNRTIAAVGLAAALVGGLQGPAKAQTATPSPMQRLEATGGRGQGYRGGPPPMPAPGPGPAMAQPDPAQIPQGQLRDQERGSFTRPEDAGRAGAQIQKAWRSATPESPIRVYDECPDADPCFYAVVTRELMITTVELPKGETIKGPIDLADERGFDVRLRGPRKFAIRPNFAGIDSNINVYTESGKTYPFYVSSESIKSNKVPFLRVMIRGRGGPIADDVKALPPAPPEAPAAGKPGGKPAAKEAAKDGPKGDFLKSAKCSAHGNYGFGQFRLEGARDLAPIQVYRDDCMTYIYFGPDKWKSIELPAAYVVWDKVDELVNTHVVGRHTLAIEAVARMITLKVGQKHLCIEYVGDSAVTASGGA